MSRIRLAAVALLAGPLLVGTPAARAADAGCVALAQRWAAGRDTLAAMQANALLLRASDLGCTDPVAAMLDGGVPLEAADRVGNTALIHAARAGRVDLVRLLLARGADLGHRNANGATALFSAAERDRPQVALLLLDRGAAPDTPGRSGATPLAAAAFNADDAIVAALLARHADPRTPDRTGKPPIVYAAARASVPIVDRLLAAGIDVNARYAHDLTALMWAAGYADAARDADGTALVRDLLDRGAHVDDADDRGRTALMIAAGRGHADVAKLLLARGADPARRDRSGRTAADLAADDAVRMVLTHG